jgi:signal transduction histidine kinase
VTARRLGDVLDRERAFSAHVSHQLRTPLTGLLLGLEAGLAEDDPHAVIRTALQRGEHLQEIIEDLVRLSRGGVGDRGVLDLPALLDEVRSRTNVSVWVPEDLPEVRASLEAVRQILHVLLDNAVTHGRPPITVSVTDLGSGLVIDVTDGGPGVPDGVDVFQAPKGGHGIGLPLARSLAEAEGGRLILRRSSPPTFSLLLPSSGYGESPV